MNTKSKRIGFVTLVSLTTLTLTAFGQLDLGWTTVDGGGDMWTDGGETGLQLSGTVGQPDANPVVMTGGTLELVGGFWALGAEGPPAPGDCDGDGDVDEEDFLTFADCLAGPDGGLGSGCACADFDLDHDVDLADFAAFQHGFTGPSR